MDRALKLDTKVHESSYEHERNKTENSSVYKASHLLLTKGHSIFILNTIQIHSNAYYCVPYASQIHPNNPKRIANGSQTHSKQSQTNPNNPKRIPNASQTHRKCILQASQTIPNASQIHPKRIGNASETHSKRIAKASQMHPKHIANASQYIPN